MTVLLSTSCILSFYVIWRRVFWCNVWLCAWIVICFGTTLMTSDFLDNLNTSNLLTTGTPDWNVCSSPIPVTTAICLSWDLNTKNQRTHYFGWHWQPHAVKDRKWVKSTSVLLITSVSARTSHPHTSIPVSDEEPPQYEICVK